MLQNTQAILAPLQAAGVSYSAECYGEAKELLRQYEWQAGSKT
jgi:hypothetical protein